MRLLHQAKAWYMNKSLDLRMGECSGFPPCCIAWFLTGWKLIYGSIEDFYDRPTWRAKLILWYHEMCGESGYVPCPLCLISGARVRVRRCTDECGHYQECKDLGKYRRWIREHYRP